MTLILTKARLLAKRATRLPGLQHPMRILWNTYEHIVFTDHIQRNLRKTDQIAEIDPLRVFWVAPNDIKAASGGSFDFLSDTGKVVDGRWDLDHGSRLTESDHLRWFKQRFHDGCAWEETDKYADRVERIKKGRSKRYATVEEFREKLQSYDRMYEEFGRGSYRLQTELADDGAVGKPGDGGRALFPSLTDHTLVRHEIAVNVGREGTLFWNDGRHRLFLALVAGLEKIPVRIVVRHAKWQQLRDEIGKVIDEAVKIGVSDGVRAYTRDALSDELEDVSLGLDHPDISIIFERRLLEN